MRTIAKHPEVIGIPVTYVPEYDEDGGAVDIELAVLDVCNDATSAGSMRYVDIGLFEPRGNGLDGVGGKQLITISLEPAQTVQVALELLRLADPEWYDVAHSEAES